MHIIHYIIVTILPTLTYSLSCHYNDSLIVSRKGILLELEDHNYVQIYNATYNITLKNKLINYEIVPSNILWLIKNIQFKGNLVHKNVNKYVETTVNSLIGYRFRKYGNVCRVSYQETNSKTRQLTFEQETAILRLAQSCIKSTVCDTDLMELDKDGNLYYQSIQSDINAFVDYIVPKLLNSFLQSDKSFAIPTVNTKSGDFSFYAKSGIISGLDGVQRTNDIFIKSENSKKFVVDFQLRSPMLKVILNEMSAKYKRIGIYGNSTIQLEGISFRANLILDLQQDRCSIHLNNIRKLAFKHITVDVPLWGFRLFSYNFDSQKLNIYETKLLNYIATSIPQFNFNCKEYIDKLSEIL